MLEKGDSWTAAQDAAVAILGLSRRIDALADVEWFSPAAGLYRSTVEAIADDCRQVRVRLASHTPPDE
jgi:hypothetical protein